MVRYGDGINSKVTAVYGDVFVWRRSSMAKANHGSGLVQRWPKSLSGFAVLLEKHPSDLDHNCS